MKIMSIGIMIMSLCNFDFREKANEIKPKYLKEIQLKYPLTVTGYGGGMMDQINYWIFMFEIPELKTKEDSRHLIVDLVKLFLEEVNGFKTIRPYFSNFPLDESGVEISVSTKNNSASVSIVNGTIYYRTTTEEEVESYQEAKKLVENQSKETGSSSA